MPSEALRCKSTCTKFVACPSMLMMIVAPGNEWHKWSRILLSSALEGELQVHLSIGGHAARREKRAGFFDRPWRHVALFWELRNRCVIKHFGKVEQSITTDHYHSVCKRAGFSDRRWPSPLIDEALKKSSVREFKVNVRPRSLDGKEEALQRRSSQNWSESWWTAARTPSAFTFELAGTANIYEHK